MYVNQTQHLLEFPVRRPPTSVNWYDQTVISKGKFFRPIKLERWVWNNLYITQVGNTQVVYVPSFYSVLCRV